ncbi:MAG: 1-acyl-sn-glycerol-3-phosphate acyltransferase [Cyclobacteriaceae bacterium]|nr:MAG: 1-acyl-sn-glycerol-3-phosphate acyltransferase [Cyclobacteriaceae bacterium]
MQKLSAVPDGPVIFVANHQNAFLDAVLIICSSHRNPWALARANVFKKWANTLLTLIQMMPVYRFRDGFDTLRKNEVIMDQCASLLKKEMPFLFLERVITTNIIIYNRCKRFCPHCTSRIAAPSRCSDCTGWTSL